MITNDSRPCTILEQAFFDQLNGLTFKFEKVESRRGDYVVLTLLGPIPHGNRSYKFDRNGVMSGMHTESDAGKIGQTFKR
jgi:hypothetical protein